MKTRSSATARSCATRSNGAAERLINGCAAWPGATHQALFWTDQFKQADLNLRAGCGTDLKGELSSRNVRKGTNESDGTSHRTEGLNTTVAPLRAARGLAGECHCNVGQSRQSRIGRRRYFRVHSE